MGIGSRLSGPKGVQPSILKDRTFAVTKLTPRETLQTNLRQFYLEANLPLPEAGEPEKIYRHGDTVTIRVPERPVIDKLFRTNPTVLEEKWGLVYKGPGIIKNPPSIPNRFVEQAESLRREFKRPE